MSDFKVVTIFSPEEQYGVVAEILDMPTQQEADALAAKIGQWLRDQGYKPTTGSSEA